MTDFEQYVIFTLGYTDVDDPNFGEQRLSQVNGMFCDLTVRWLKLTAQLRTSTYVHARLAKLFLGVLTAGNPSIS